MNALLPRALLGAILVGLLSPAEAQEPPSPGKPPAEGRHGGGPPPEAYKACEGKSAGSRAEMTDARGEVLKGVCEDEGGGKTVLRPDRPPGGGHRSPPPGAYAACAGKSAGARAQFASPRGDTVAGTCESEGARLVLRPDRPPPHGDGGGKREE